MTPDDELTADQVFGTEPPGVAVPSRPAFDACAGYRLRPQFRYRDDGRAYRIGKDEFPETELPDASCPDGSQRCARHDGRD